MLLLPRHGGSQRAVDDRKGGVNHQVGFIDVQVVGALRGKYKLAPARPGGQLAALSSPIALVRLRHIAKAGVGLARGDNDQGDLAKGVDGSSLLGALAECLLVL
jgi:hypothetical protein